MRISVAAVAVALAVAGCSLLASARPQTGVDANKRYDVEEAPSLGYYHNSLNDHLNLAYAALNGFGQPAINHYAVQTDVSLLEPRPFQVTDEKNVLVPVPRPVAVPVEKRVPLPVPYLVSMMILNRVAVPGNGNVATQGHLNTSVDGLHSSSYLHRATSRTGLSAFSRSLFDHLHRLQK